jgi:hypothetical protein
MIFAEPRFGQIRTNQTNSPVVPATADVLGILVVCLNSAGERFGKIQTLPQQRVPSRFGIFAICPAGGRNTYSRCSPRTSSATIQNTLFRIGSPLGLSWTSAEGPATRTTARTSSCSPGVAPRGSQFRPRVRGGTVGFGWTRGEAIEAPLPPYKNSRRRTPSRHPGFIAHDAPAITTALPVGSV